MKKLENIKNAFLIGVCALAALLSAFYPTDKQSTQTIANTQSLYGETNEQRLSFFYSNGVNTESEPCEITEVIIPLEFTAIYAKYEALQKSQGLSLEGYKGSRARRYSYVVSDKSDTLAEILVANGKIIAAALVPLSENENSGKNNGGFGKIIT